MRIASAALLVFWILGYSLFSGDWEEAYKLAPLVEHYQEHAGTDVSVSSFLDFIAEHYINLQDSEDSEHNSLPFFSHHLPVSFALTTTFNFTLFLEDNQAAHNPILKIWTPVSHSVLILQPPQA